jgi:3-hydroxybutyryl-CoA dehydrogenase
MRAVRRVGVVGCGVLGSGIAEVCASRGLDVLVALARTESVASSRRLLQRSLDGAVRKQKVTEADRDAALARVEFTTDLANLGDRQVVFEAVPEDEQTKLSVFGVLDKVVTDHDAILASTTSSIPVVRLARATDRGDHVIGTHFFSPVPAMPLVELTATPLTEDRVCDDAESFLTDGLGKQVIRTPDRSGFVVNALLIPYLMSAIRMVESGFATAEVVDRGMVLGCSHPMGPLSLLDYIGLDTIASVAAIMHAELNEPQYAPPPLLLRMVEAGRLGRKSGQGFHSYPTGREVSR